MLQQFKSNWANVWWQVSGTARVKKKAVLLFLLLPFCTFFLDQFFLTTLRNSRQLPQVFLLLSDGLSIQPDNLKGLISHLAKASPFPNLDQTEQPLVKQRLLISFVYLSIYSSLASIQYEHFPGCSEEGRGQITVRKISLGQCSFNGFFSRQSLCCFFSTPESLNP